MNNSSQFHSHMEAPAAMSTTTNAASMQSLLNAANRTTRNSGPFIRKPLGGGGLMMKTTGYKRGVTK